MRRGMSRRSTRRTGAKFRPRRKGNETAGAEHRIEIYATEAKSLLPIKRYCELSIMNTHGSPGAAYAFSSVLPIAHLASANRGGGGAPGGTKRLPLRRVRR